MADLGCRGMCDGDECRGGAGRCWPVGVAGETVGGYVLLDKALIEQAQRRLNVVVDHMNPNRILFLWWLDKNDADD